MIHRIIAISFKNNTKRTLCTEYYLLKIEMKNYNVINDVQRYDYTVAIFCYIIHILKKLLVEYYRSK